MIVKLIISPFIGIINLVISALPFITNGSNSTTALLNMLITGMNFFPTETWFMVLGSISFWITVHLAIGLIRFVLSFIPIVNMGN